MQKFVFLYTKNCVNLYNLPVDARNAADGLIHTTEKTLAEHAAKIDPATKAEVERAAGDLKRAAHGDNVEEFK